MRGTREELMAILEKSVGKRVFVLKDGGFFANIVGVKSPVAFLVEGPNGTIEVDCYDVRYFDSNNET